MNDIGQILRFKRLEKHMSLEALSKHVPADISTLSRCERGALPIDIRLYISWIKALGDKSLLEMKCQSCPIHIAKKKEC